MTLAFLVVALALPGAAWASHGTYRLTYFSNAHTSGAPDAQVRIINPGASDTELNTVTVPIDLCAMIFVYRPDQEFAECCGCKVTPNGLITLSVNDDLTRNPTHAGDLPTGVIKIVSTFTTTSTAPPGSSPECNPGDPLWESARELRSWGTHIQDAGGGSFQITETALEGNDHSTTLLSGEELRLKTQCGFVVGGVIAGAGQTGFGLCHCQGEANPNPGIDPPIVGTVNPPAAPPVVPPIVPPTLP
jgi:hypothetical protein